MFYGTNVQSVSEAERPYSSTDVCIWPYGKEDRKMSLKLCSMEKSKNYLGMSDAPSPSPEMLLARCESLGDTAGLEQCEPSAHPAIVRALGGLSLVLEFSVHKPQEA